MNNFKKRDHTSLTTTSAAWTKSQIKSSIVSPNDAVNRGVFQVTYKLTKNSNDNDDDIIKNDNDNKESKENVAPKVYSIFALKKKIQPQLAVVDTTTSSSCQFDEMYRNAFRRKKNINLYISGQQVIWEFAFDRTIMAAIKEYIPNRTFDGGMKKWVNPVESLPEAIELYEFMGRTPDDCLVQRSKQIVQAREVVASRGGTDPSEIITLTVSPALSTTDSNNSTRITTMPSPFGTANVQFVYKPTIVDALKMLPTNQRQYDPATKVWTIDLMALPDLLESFVQLGYCPNKKLTALCDKCRALAQVMCDEARDDEVSIIDVDEDDSKDDNLIINVDDDDDDDNLNGTGASSSQAQLGQALESLQQLLESHQDYTRSSASCSPSAEITINRDDCGSSKRPKLTVAQEVWSLKKKGGIDDLDFDSDDGFIDYDTLASRVLSRRSKIESKVEAKADPDCDCGRPFILSGGVHVCRYYGHFECDNCHHQWTSAYTWKGERQGCRRCETESYPVRKERLQSGLGVGGDRQHDSARCSRCKKLGYCCGAY